MPKTTTGGQDLKLVNPGAAALDIGSTLHMAAVNPDCTDAPVRSFGTFTRDLHELADWFRACGVTSVAMESTGVYWIPVFEVPTASGTEAAEVLPWRATVVTTCSIGRPIRSAVDLMMRMFA